MQSIIICTHNPDIGIFIPVLDAVSTLRWPAGCDQEIILVDNASSMPLSEDPMIRDWLERTPGVHCVREDRLGLAWARVRAFREARGDWLVCFDDDNAPAPDYLEVLTRAIGSYPFVGVWGPGRVEVEWGTGADPDVVSGYAKEFQARNQDRVTFALDFPLPDTMPYGTGMALTRAVAEGYAAWHAERQPGTTDRKGASLASAGDVQIGWLAMRDGWAVGRHPDMALRHLVPTDRARMSYTARLRFGKARSFAPAMREAIPEYFQIPVPGSARLAGRITARLFRRLFKPGSPPLSVLLAGPLGSATGAWRAHGRRAPWWVRLLTRGMYGP